MELREIIYWKAGRWSVRILTVIKVRGARGFIGREITGGFCVRVCRKFGNL